MNLTQMQEMEQKLKLSVGNIIAIAAFLTTLIGAYINIKSTLADYNQRLVTLEKNNEEMKDNFEKFNLKLDKIIENVTRIQLDNANQRVIDAEKKIN